MTSFAAPPISPSLSFSSSFSRASSNRSLLVRDSDSPGAARRNIFTTTATTSSSSIHRSPLEDTTTIGRINYGEEESDEEEISVHTPVALLIPVVDDDDEISSTIDAACELVATNSILTRSAAGTAIGTTNR